MDILEAATLRPEALGAVRSGATLVVYDTLFLRDPNRPSVPTEGLKAAQLAATHARTSVLTKAIVAQAPQGLSDRQLPRARGAALQTFLYVFNK